jgi:hypothetical protein
VTLLLNIDHAPPRGARNCAANPAPTEVRS